MIERVRHCAWALFLILRALALAALVTGCNNATDLRPGNGFISVLVVDEPVRVPDVEVSIIGSGQVLTTDSTGVAFFDVPPGDYFVDASVCCLGPGSIDYHVPVTVEAGKLLEVTLRACLRCVCASPETPIATPRGIIPMGSLAVGDLVYSLHRGCVTAVPVQETNRVEVHAHRVVRVNLSTGAVLEISPGHPTADGRTFADLRAGEWIGSVQILSVQMAPYERDHTVDILPSSDSGVYFAGGIPIGSTLHEVRPLVTRK